jgi:phosphoadenosine phosphosulfate reductase
MENIETLLSGIDPKDAPTVLSRAIDHFGDQITMATSFQLGGLVLLDMIHKLGKEIQVFSLDTGRLPEETYQCSESIRLKYGIQVQWVFPHHEAVEKMEREKGLYSFKENTENRKECCGIRKVEPLNRALKGYSAWITGRRMDQSASREDLKFSESDHSRPGMFKVNPLIHWSQSDLWFYAKENNVPYNHLYDEGYLSIGCECCTRPCRDGEDERAGRWWWESTEHKECGLHLRGGAGI